MQKPEQTDISFVVAKLCRFSRHNGLSQVLVKKMVCIEDVLTFVHDHSLGEDYQIGIVWIKDAHGALHYGLLDKGHLINDKLTLDDGLVLNYDVFKNVQPKGTKLIRHISTAYEQAAEAINPKVKLIP